MMRRLATTLAAIAVLTAPTAMAQDADRATTEDAAEVAELPDSEPEPASEELAGTYILSASDRFLAAYGSETWLAPELEVCLEEGEQVQLGQTGTQIASMELRGALCTRVADAEEVATIVVERERRNVRVRAGATRGVSARPASVSVPVFRVATGTGDVLSQFPAGTRVTADVEICLQRGQQVTLISSRGQRVTYRGPGCARRNARPSATNQGGFTFGWKGFGRGSDFAVLP